MPNNPSDTVLHPSAARSISFRQLLASLSDKIQVYWVSPLCNYSSREQITASEPPGWGSRSQRDGGGRCCSVVGFLVVTWITQGETFNVITDWFYQPGCRANQWCAELQNEFLSLIWEILRPALSLRHTSRFPACNEEDKWYSFLQHFLQNKFLLCKLPALEKTRRWMKRSCS